MYFSLFDEIVLLDSVLLSLLVVGGVHTRICVSSDCKVQNKDHEFLCFYGPDFINHDVFVPMCLLFS
jgi:hypothetical protein